MQGHLGTRLEEHKETFVGMLISLDDTGITDVFYARYSDMRMIIGLKILDMWRCLGNKTFQYLCRQTLQAYRNAFLKKSLPYFAQCHICKLPLNSFCCSSFDKFIMQKVAKNSKLSLLGVFYVLLI